MLNKLFALMLALFAAAAFAAVDVNKATQAELDGVKGIGPSIAGKILDERKKGAFKDWSDFIERVKGVGEGNAAKFSAEGLTVNGTSFGSAAPKAAAATAPAAKKDDKPAPKAEAKSETKKEAAPAAAATPAATAAPLSAADKKAAAKKEKEEKKAAAEAAKKEKADKAAAAKADKAKDGKPAAAATPVAASAPKK